MERNVTGLKSDFWSKQEQNIWRFSPKTSGRALKGLFYLILLDTNFLKLIS